MPESANEPQEIILFTKEYRGSEMDFRPMPVDPTEEVAPKDLSAVESADSSEVLTDPILTPPVEPVMHPSQLPLPAPSVSVEKDSGKAKDAESLNPTSSTPPKTG